MKIEDLITHTQDLQGYFTDEDDADLVSEDFGIHVEKIKRFAEQSKPHESMIELNKALVTLGMIYKELRLEMSEEMGEENTNTKFLYIVKILVEGLVFNAKVASAVSADQIKS